MHTDIIAVAVGIAGIVIGVAVSYYFYRVSLHLKEPCWSIRSNNLIKGYSSRLNDLKIDYKSQTVENLTISKILFWNAGAETIRREDITSANPLRILGDSEVLLLDSSVLARSSQSNGFACTLGADNKAALIDFDYLDQGQGAVIQIVHTGVSPTALTIQGDLKGVKDLKEKSIDIVNYLPLPTSGEFDEKISPAIRRRLKVLITALFGVIIFSVPFIMFLYFDVTDLMRYARKDRLFLGVVSLQLGIFLVLASYLIYKAVHTWRGGPPKGLEEFENDFF